MKKILLILLFVMVIYAVGAEANPCGNDRDFIGYKKQYSNITLIQKCDNCTYVNISSYTFPNSTVIILNKNMTKNGIDYDYLFINGTEIGCQSYTVYGDKDGGYKIESFDFIINPTGIPPSESRTTAVSRTIYFTFGIAIILLIAFLFINSKPPVKWTLFLLSMMFLLVSLNILFVGLQDEVVNPKIENFFDIFTASFYYLFWGMFGILAVLWILTTIQTLLLKNKSTQMEKYG